MYIDAIKIIANGYLFAMSVNRRRWNRRHQQMDARTRQMLLCIGVRCARKTVQPSIHRMSDRCARIHCTRSQICICGQPIDLFHLIVHTAIPTHLTFQCCCWWTECQIWHSGHQSLRSCHTAEVKVSAGRLLFASQIPHSFRWRS